MDTLVAKDMRGLFPVSVCGLGMEGFGIKNPGSSVVFWRADWTVGSQELVLVNTYAPSKFYVMFFSLYCIIVSRFTNTFFDCFNIFIGPLCKH